MGLVRACGTRRALLTVWAGIPSIALAVGLLVTSCRGGSKRRALIGTGIGIWSLNASSAVRYFPDGHCVHSSGGPNVPAPHISLQSLMSSLPGADASLPSGQAQHVLFETAPGTLDHVPLSHKVHSTLPSAAAKVPGTHLRHTVADVAPMADAYLPRAQRVHIDPVFAPGTFENVPAGHKRQSLSCTLPSAAAYLPAPQSRHVSSEVAPRSVEYLPRPQGTQSVAFALPSVGRYLPAGHSMHTRPSAPVTAEPTVVGISQMYGLLPLQGASFQQPLDCKFMYAQSSFP